MNKTIATSTADCRILSDERIANLNNLRETPCTTENGECWIVQAVRAYVDSEVFRVESVNDINVFATEGEARACAADMTDKCHDGGSCIKYMYTVRCHRIDL